MYAVDKKRYRGQILKSKKEIQVGFTTHRKIHLSL